MKVKDFLKDILTQKSKLEIVTTNAGALVFLPYSIFIIFSNALIHSFC